MCRTLSGQYHIIGLDVSPPSESFDNFEFREVDLTDSNEVAVAFDAIREQTEGQIASVLHLAAYYDFTGEDSALYNELTVEGTRRLLDALQHFECVEQFVFSSTLLVMMPDEQPIDEDDPTRAEWPYPASKLTTERVIHEHRGSIPTVILRIAGVYDHHCHSWPVSQQIARIYEKQWESYFFPGDPDHGTSLVHLDDLVNAVSLTIERRHELNDEDVFLIAEPDVMTYGELQDQIGNLIYHQDWTTIRIPKVVAKAGARVMSKFADDERDVLIKPWMVDLADDHYEAEISKAQQKLGWSPIHRLRDVLPFMIDHLRKSPQRFYEDNHLPVPDRLPALQHKS